MEGHRISEFSCLGSWVPLRLESSATMLCTLTLCVQPMYSKSQIIFVFGQTSSICWSNYGKGNSMPKFKDRCYVRNITLKIIQVWTGIRAHTSAVLYQLSYQANWELVISWARKIPVGGEGMQVNTLLIEIAVCLQLLRPLIRGEFKEVIQNKKSTSSRGISSFLSHLLGHGSGSLGHSSARCAWKTSFIRQCFRLLPGTWEKFNCKCLITVIRAT